MSSIFENIVKHEGYKSKVYKDHLGNDTIGYGFLVSELELSKELCDIILYNKVMTIYEMLGKNIKNFNKYPIEIQNVLIEMAYQLGIAGLFKFKKTLEYAANKDWQNMAKEMMNSYWAEQTPNRARDLQKQVLKETNENRK